MKTTPKHPYSHMDFHELESLFEQYLSHRLGHHTTHATFKRFLVAKGKRYFCDLFDDYRRGLTQFPCHWSRSLTFGFTAHMSNDGDPYGIRLQRF